MTLFCLSSPSRILVEIRTEIFLTKVVSMPIRVTCQCGQNLNVPDAMAGKTGKCPKCKQPLKIPGAATPAAVSVTPAASAKATKAPTVVQVNSSLAGLFEEAGLSQRKGEFCPNCDEPKHPVAVICVKCGLSFIEGTKIEGHQVVVSKKFGNKNLDHAEEMMAREVGTQNRMLQTGAPWWMMFAFLAGLVILIAGVAVKMDAGQTGTISTVPLMAKIQKAQWIHVLSGSLGMGSILIAIFAYLAILFNSFYESAKQGLLCLFVPLYIVFYMFSRMFSRKLWNTILIFFITAILAGVCLGFALPKI